ILPTLLLASCAPQPNGVGNKESQTAVNKQQVEEQTTDEQQPEQDGAEDAEHGREDPALEGKQGTTNAQQEPTQEVAAEKPSPIQTPQETKFEALVLAGGGTKLYAEPNAQAKAVGSLVFGEHVFALL